MTRLSSKKKYIKIKPISFQLSSNIYWIILFLLPLIYAAVKRSLNVGSDTAGVYRNIYFGGYAVNHWRPTIYEGLFIQYVKLVYKINPKFEFLLGLSVLIICSIFITYFVLRRKNINIMISLLVFFVWLYCPSYNVLRQILAVSCSFIGLVILEKNRPICGVIIFTIASFIHITSIIVFIYYIPYFFAKKQKWRKIVPLIFLLGPFITKILITSLIQISFFSKFAESLQPFNMSNMNTKFFIFPVMVFPLILLYWNEIIRLDTFNYIHLCGFIFIFTAVFLSGYLWYAFRMMYYFIPSEAIILGQLGRCCKNRKQRFLVNLYLVVALLGSFLFVYVYHDTDGIYPYLFNNL